MFFSVTNYPECLSCLKKANKDRYLQWLSELDRSGCFGLTPMFFIADIFASLKQQLKDITSLR